MSGGLYRSAHAAHAARDGDGDGPPDEATLISVDPGGAAGLVEPPGQDQARPIDEVSAAAGDGGAPHTTAGNSAIMAALSLISRVLGFVRNALIGMTLGAAVGNAYTTAQFLPGQIYELLLGGILSSVLVPILVRRRRADPDAGQAFTQKLLTLAVVGLGIATLLAVTAAPVFTALQVSDQGNGYRHLTTFFAYLLLPIIFFTGLSALMGAVLNVRGHFAAPMWAPILNSLVIIAACGVFIAVFGLGRALTVEQMTPGRVLVIGGGTLLGMVAQAVGLLPALRRVGFVWKWSWDPRSLGLREITRLAGWMLCYVAANQVGVFVVVNLLNRVEEDTHNAGVLTFNYAFLLMMMAHGIIGVSVMTALLPRMSAAAADGRFVDLKADLTYGIRMTTTALAPIAVLYIVLGTPIAVALFQGGRFQPADAYAAGPVVAVAGFAVLPLSISYLCTYTFYALQGNKTAALINLPVVAIRIGVQIALFVLLPLALVAAGMTAGNGISYLASAAISLVVLRRRIGRLGLRAVVGSLTKVFIAAVVAAALGLVVVHLLPGGAHPGKGAAILQVVVGSVVIFVSYLGVASALRLPEVARVVGMVRRRIRR